MSDKNKISESWIDIPISDKKEVSHTIGPVTIHIKKFKNEIWIAYAYAMGQVTEQPKDLTKRTKDDDDEIQLSEGPPKASASGKPADLKWNRWAMREEINEVSFRPIFPDRSVVIKPEYPFKIAHKASVKVYTRIPVFIRITPTKFPDHIITEIPSIKMTGTWFGDFLTGELCYRITTTARREISDELYEDHLCFAPLYITNNADEDLPFDKMSLKVDQLSIFKGPKGMWADETKITYTGEDNLSEITMTGKTPSEIKDPVLLMKPRLPVRKNMAVRTFRMIKDLPTFGLLNI